MNEGRDFSDVAVSVAAGLLGGFLFLAISSAVFSAESTAWLPTLVGLASAVGVFATVAVMLKGMRVQRVAAERQLRAYLMPVSCNLVTKDGTRVEFFFENTGQTPAYDVVLASRCKFDRAEGPDYADTDWAIVRFGDVGPRQSRGHMSPLEVDVVEAASDGMRSEETFLWHEGMIEYRDAFGSQRQTHFSHFMIGPIRETGFSFHVDGNRST